MAGGKTNTLESILQDLIFGNVAHGLTLGSLQIGLLSASPTNDETTGLTELSGGGYARQVVTNDLNTWNDSSGGGQKQNDDPISFPTATGDWLRAVSWAAWDNGGTPQLLYWGPLIENLKQGLVNDVANDTILSPGHGWANDTIVRTFPASGGGAFPGSTPALSQDTQYWVAQAATDTFKLSTEEGGGAIVNFSALGFIEVAEDKSVVVTTGGTASFGAGTLVVQED